MIRHGASDGLQQNQVLKMASQGAPDEKRSPAPTDAEHPGVNESIRARTSGYTEVSIP